MMAFKENFINASPKLLEPIYKVTITAPEEITGAIMSTIQSHRSMVEGMDAEGHFTIIKAQIPIAEMHEFTNDLRSLSQGRARITMEFDHYESVPYEIQNKLIADFAKEAVEV
jgi:elongation factor G